MLEWSQQQTVYLIQLAFGFILITIPFKPNLSFINISLPQFNPHFIDFRLIQSNSNNQSISIDWIELNLLIETEIKCGIKQKRHEISQKYY